jgi:mutator protein MutT
MTTTATDSAGRHEDRPPIRVVAAVLTAGPGAPPCPTEWLHETPEAAMARAFLVGRKAAGKRLAGLWELPGGKIEPGERAEDTLVREIAEELGLEVVPGEHVATHAHRYDFGVVVLEAWRGTIVGGAWRMTDHDLFAWVSPDEALAFPLAPADIPLVEALRG